MRETQVRKARDHKGLFGNLKGKLSGYVAAYREDMAMVLALVKFFFLFSWFGFGLCIYYYPSLTRIFDTAPSQLEKLSDVLLKSTDGRA